VTRAPWLYEKRTTLVYKFCQRTKTTTPKEVVQWER
jgi:hypothetical protein